jgi:hypothetical protein
MSTPGLSVRVGDQTKANGHSARAGRFGSLRARLLLALCSILLLIAFLEGVTRIAVLLAYGQQDKGFHHIFTYETFLVARTNERFRFTYAPKVDHFRILILGGSTADNLSRMSPEFYARVFEKLTNKPLEVINFAQAGSISSQELVMLARYGLRVEPDLVIAIDGVNDIVGMTKGMPPGIPYTDAYVQLAMNHPFLNAVVTVAQRSQFVNALRKLKERREEKALQLNANAVSLAVAEYITNQSAMATVADGIGAKFVTVLQPYIHLRKTNTPNERALRAMTNYAYRKKFMTDVLSSLSTQLSRRDRGPSAAFIDSTSFCDESTKDCFVDEAHLTFHGNELLLLHIANELDRTWRGALSQGSRRSVDVQRVEAGSNRDELRGAIEAIGGRARR